MATFTEDFTRLRQDCDQSHQDRLDLIDNIQGEIQTLRDETVPDLIGGFRAAHNEMATQLRGDLAEFAGDLSTGGEIFRGGPSATQTAPSPKTRPKKARKATKSRRK